MTLEEAKSKMTKESIDKLIDLTTVKNVIDTSKKSMNDILMQALCNAVNSGVIASSSLDDKTIKMLNSPTNTLAEQKMYSMLEHVRKSQPTLICEMVLRDELGNEINKWIFPGDQTFNDMFEYVINKFEITPHRVRTQMSKILKDTIVNNIAQLITKYNMMEDKKGISISITTVFRLVCMENHTLTAEFKNL